MVLAMWAGVGAFVVCGEPRRVCVAGEWRRGEASKRHLVDRVERAEPGCAAVVAVRLLRGIVGRYLRDVALAADRGGAAVQHGGDFAAGGVGTTVLNSAKREWLSVIPSRTSSQVIVLVCMVAFGAMLQWRCAPRVTRVDARGGRDESGFSSHKNRGRAAE